MTQVKICGITRVEDARVAASYGADYLGLIFVPSSPRYVEPEAAAEITAAVKGPKFVGVFRDCGVDEVHRVCVRSGIDMIQFHGTESDEDIHTLGMPSIKAYRVGETLPDTNAHPAADYVLFDTFDTTRDGGTGRRFDWSLLAMYPRTKPFFLAGGIGPENVAAAISLVRPDAIDISSAVESAPGVKDHEKLRILFERVKRS
ncbi:MAG: phosphoribosylanthranilate isomerase [Acidobacteriota bacterium]|nr:phosphoribosylanthranilate isomerase [Acidobacteriota bacterium]